MVNRAIIFAASFTTFFLIGCVNHIQSGNISGDKIHDGSYADFSLEIPNEISKKIHRADQSDAYITYDNTTVERESTDFSIWIFPPTSLGDVSSCSPSLTGASQTTVLVEAGAKAEWGLVDFWDIYDSGQGWIDYDGEPPVCRSSDSPSGASYAFCSEKEEKTVVICVTQQTNNAALAKDIFETFRWME